MRPRIVTAINLMSVDVTYSFLFRASGLVCLYRVERRPPYCWWSWSNEVGKGSCS